MALPNYEKTYNEINSSIVYGTAVSNNYYTLNELSLKKIGNMVVGRLAISTNTVSNDIVTIGTLPPGFVPSITRSFDFCQNAAATGLNLRFYFESNGNLTARWGATGTQSYISIMYIL